MWIGDVGQGAWEEIDYRPADSTNGVNYGWRCLKEMHHTTQRLVVGRILIILSRFNTYPNPSPAAVTGGVYIGGLPTLHLKDITWLQIFIQVFFTGLNMIQ
jgi:hypothetical protein